MKRSLSRASKATAEVQDYPDNSIPGIPDSKWHEFLEKEDSDNFILGLREEIVEKTLEICFEKYLERQAVAFTVHCAYLAWCKTINMFYMFRDPGDTEDPEVIESWQPDPEPEPSIIDSWGSKCISSMDPTPPVRKKEKEVPKPSPVTTVKEESLDSCSFMSDLFGEEETEFYLYSETLQSSSLSSVIQKRSIFTRTLSMSRESLPLLDPMALPSPCKEEEFDVKKKT